MNNASAKDVIELTEGNFRKEVLEGDLPVLIDFWAPWCGPCRMMTPILHEAAAKLGGIARVAKLNVDEQPRLAEIFGVRGIPTLVLMNKDTVLDSWSGVTPANAVVDRVKAKVPR
ncbi:MAG TPA: thioredoxin [Fimbriimonas sp.]|nr:thioredoxin [Fimbriimonas sp.]